MKNMTWRQKSRLLIPWITLSLYWVSIFTLTHISHVPVAAGGSDKVAHFGAYFLLTLFFWWTCFGRKPLRFNSKKPYFTIITVAFYGAVDEFSQRFVSGRVCDVRDWVFDMAGMFFALMMILMLRKLIYWFIISAGGFMAVMHHPGRLRLFKLQGKFAELAPVYVMLAFLLMTIVLWRCWCPDKFRNSKFIFGITSFVMISFAFVSEIYRLATKQIFIYANVGAAILGIVFAIVFCVLMAKQAEADEVYQQFPVQEIN
ncbi:MAG: VanZ family protein [Phycisphaerae bacterium]|nr:VanZ family protein [Phycisphaerae bacterium]